jgi:hypothetical protein
MTIKCRRRRLTGHVVRMGKMRNTNTKFVTLEEKRPLGRPRRIWEYNIKTGLREMWFEDLDWIPLTADVDRWWDI